jgi:hypothetical protein
MSRMLAIWIPITTSKLQMNAYRDDRRRVVGPRGAVLATDVSYLSLLQEGGSSSWRDVIYPHRKDLYDKKFWSCAGTTRKRRQNRLGVLRGPTSGRPDADRKGLWTLKHRHRFVYAS